MAKSSRMKRKFKRASAELKKVRDEVIEEFMPIKNSPSNSRKSIGFTVTVEKPETNAFQDSNHLDPLIELIDMLNSAKIIDKRICVLAKTLPGKLQNPFENYSDFLPTQPNGLEQFCTTDDVPLTENLNILFYNLNEESDNCIPLVNSLLYEINAKLTTSMVKLNEVTTNKLLEDLGNSLSLFLGMKKSFIISAENSPTFIMQKENFKEVEAGLIEMAKHIYSKYDMQIHSKQTSHDLSSPDFGDDILLVGISETISSTEDIDDY